ncbi:hypothetical protein HRED_03259, partial [Candidatus Haloredivivus sp. G17]
MEAENWEKRLSYFPEAEQMDEARFAEIEGLKLEEGSVHPCIKIRINDEWHYLFFQVNDEVKKC